MAPADNLFTVEEVFRLPHRGGPVLVGRRHGVNIAAGTKLRLPDGAGGEVLEVLGVDFMPAPTNSNEVTIVVSPDPGRVLRAGVVLRVLVQDTP